MESLAPDLRTAFLEGMSRAACTVNVVTTDGTAGRAGVTISAMTSVSADGDDAGEGPTLLVCIHHQSRTATKIIENGRFVANLLAEGQTEISDTFAGRLPAPEGDKFRCGRWRDMPSGAPRCEGAVAAFDCEVVSAERVGTHHIFIGRVRDIHTETAGRPLIFFNRNYATPGMLDAAR